MCLEHGLKAHRPPATSNRLFEPGLKVPSETAWASRGELLPDIRGTGTGRSTGDQWNVLRRSFDRYILGHAVVSGDFRVAIFTGNHSMGLLCCQKGRRFSAYEEAFPLTES